MSSSTVVRLANGGTVSVRTGVLRGAGPQGPMGPAGSKGDKGDPGPTGPQPAVVQQRSHFTSTASVATGGDGNWYDVAMPLVTDGSEPQNLIATPSDPFNWKFLNTGSYFGYLRLRFEPRTGSEFTGVAANSRRMRIIDAGTSAVVAEVSESAAPTEPTILAMPVFFGNVDVTHGYKVQAYSDDSAGVNVTNRSLRLFIVGAGPAGPAGPQGLVGLTGPQGATGPTGSAGTGYASFNALIGGTDSTLDPGVGDAATPDQGIPYPLGTATPSLPYFLQAAINFIERRIVSKYSSAADRTAKRGSRQIGEITYLDDNGNFMFREKSGTDLDIARVIYSASAPPTGAGQAAPGVLWVQF